MPQVEAMAALSSWAQEREDSHSASTRPSSSVAAVADSQSTSLVSADDLADSQSTSLVSADDLADSQSTSLVSLDDLADSQSTSFVSPDEVADSQSTSLPLAVGELVAVQELMC